MMKILLVIITFVTYLQAQKTEDLVTELPGLNITVPKGMYSGFYKLNKNKHLHYVYFESDSKPDTDPIIVWFNGGPGAASFHLAFAGIGPYMTLDMKTLIPWKHTWTREANILMIDNPAGVGFSFAKRDIDYKTTEYSYQ